MSVQLKILYGHNYDRCKTATILEQKLENLDLESLTNVIWETVGTFYQGVKTLRMQYRDDEGTFITITTEQDVKDATLCCKPMPTTYESKMTRLCLRVDDACTPVNAAPQKRPRNTGTTSETRKKGLFVDSIATDEEEDGEIFTDSSVGQCSSMHAPIESPYERYAKKVKSNIETKKSALFEVERKEQEIHRKIHGVKSDPADGNMCRNCHMRVGHTARRCEYEKCSSVFSCGEEKLHPGEIDSRGTRYSIQKLKGDIAKLQADLDLKEQSSKKLSESLSNKIENKLLQENADLYVQDGIKKWSILRKHVFVIEKHCKKHFGGKIPARNNLSEILSIALEERNTSQDRSEELQTTRVRGNPAKDLLQTKGIYFPDANVASTSQPNLLHRCAPSTKDEEQEQLNMVLKQSMLESTPSIPTMVPQTITSGQQLPTPVIFDPSAYYRHMDPRMNPYYFYQGTPMFQPSFETYPHQTADLPNNSTPYQSYETTSCGISNESSYEEIGERTGPSTETRDVALQLLSLTAHINQTDNN